MGLEKLAQTDISISDFFATYWNLFSETSKKTEQERLNLATNDFIKLVSMKSHKARATDVEKRIALKNNWAKNKKSNESGDLIDKDGNCVEVKSSIVNPVKSTVTLRGFRPWESQVAYYIVVILDVRNFRTQVRFDVFNLPAAYITAANGFKPFNQSKSARASSTNVPLGIDFDIDDGLFLTWSHEFKVSNISF